MWNTNLLAHRIWWIVFLNVLIYIIIFNFKMRDKFLIIQVFILFISQTGWMLNIDYTYFVKRIDHTGIELPHVSFREPELLNSAQFAVLSACLPMQGII